MAWPTNPKVPDPQTTPDYYRSVKVVFGPNASASGGGGTIPQTTGQWLPKG